MGKCKQVVKAPIFVVGTPRSGTTLTAKILGKHSRLFMPGETHFFDDIYARRGDLGDTSDPLAIKKIVDRLQSIYDRYFELPDQQRVNELFSDPVALEQLKRPHSDYKEVLSCFMEIQMRHEGKQRWGNNVPRDIFNVDDILSLYPDAKFVVCIRDVRDFMLSYKGKWRVTGDAHTERLKQLYHPVVTSILWKSSMRLLPAIQKKIPTDNLIIIRYEELVTNPVDVVQKICELVGEEFEPAMLDVDTHNSSNRSESKGIFSTSVERWRTELSPDEIAVAQWLTTLELTTLGYPLERVAANPLKVIGIFAATPFALWKALRANAGTRGPLLPYLLRRISSLVTGQSRY